MIYTPDLEFIFTPYLFRLPHRLDGLVPVPRNITKERTPPPSVLTTLGPLIQGPMYLLSAGARTVIRFGDSFLGSSSSSSTSNSSSNSISNSTADGDVEKKLKSEKEEEGDEEDEVFVDPTGATLLHSSSEDLTCDAEGTCLAPTPEEVVAALALAAAKSGDKAVPAVAPKRPAAHVTEEDWSHMQSYTEPQHLSLHASQLSGVRTGVLS
jgi:hypothetical protein